MEEEFDFSFVVVPSNKSTVKESTVQ